MIELNCSYEESKKILELGYDFSKICWTSLYEYRDQHNLNKTFIKIHVHGTGLSLTLIEDQIKHQMGKYGVVDSLIPIIPKAALEACLPEKEFGDEPLAGNAALCYSRSFRKHFKDYRINQFSVWELGTKEEDIKGCGLTTYFKSAFKAFLWCHEHYPEELKKKFSEVMNEKTI